MKLSICIYPDKRYKSDRSRAGRLRFFMQLTGRGMKKIIRELPENYSVPRDDYNFKKRLITGSSLEAITIRDRHFKLVDMVRSLDGSLEENLTAIATHAGVSFKNISVVGTNITRAVTLRDYARKFIDIKRGVSSESYLNRFVILIKNLTLFVDRYQVGGDDMHTKSSDEQKVFFAKYIDFLLNDEIVPPDPHDKRKGGKKKYENVSVVAEISRINSLKKEFENIGIKINMDSLTRRFKTPVDSDDVPHVLIEEARAILDNFHLADGITEKKVIHNCLFQYFTGLRLNELSEVKDSNITTKIVDGRSFKALNYVSDKTGKRNQVPLPQVCLDIIEYWRTRWNGVVVLKKGDAEYRPSTQRRDTRKINEYVRSGADVPAELANKYHIVTGCLLPILSDSSVGVSIKSFLKKIPLFHNTTKRIRYRGNERIEENIPRWDILTSHSFRHGYSALLSAGGVDTDSIGKLLNHSSGATTKKHYEHFQRDALALRALDVLNKAR